MKNLHFCKEKLPNSPFGFCRDVEVFEGCNDGLEFAEARSEPLFWETIRGGEGSRWLDGWERMSIKSSSSEISMGTAEKCDVALARIRVGAKVGPVLLHRYRSQAWDSVQTFLHYNGRSRPRHHKTSRCRSGGRLFDFSFFLHFEILICCYSRLWCFLFLRYWFLVEKFGRRKMKGVVLFFNFIFYGHNLFSDLILLWLNFDILSCGWWRW